MRVIREALGTGVLGLPEAFNARVKTAVRSAIVQQGRRALSRIPREERAKSSLVDNLGLVIKDVEVSGCRETFGNRHPSTLVAINNYASLLMTAGEVEAAGPMYLESYAARREMLGEEHIDTLMSQNNLGVSRYASGDLVQATSLLRDALAKRRAVIGSSNPSSLKTMHNLALALKAQGQLDEAESLLRETLDGRCMILGNTHVDTLKSLNALGSLFYQRGDFDKALPLYREAVSVGREVLGERHPVVLSSMNNLGNALHTYGLKRVDVLDEPTDDPGREEMDEAAKLLREAHEISRDVLGAQHLDTLSARPSRKAPPKLHPPDPCVAPTRSFCCPRLCCSGLCSPALRALWLVARPGSLLVQSGGVAT